MVDALAAALGDDGVDSRDAVEKVVVFRDELTLDVRREHLPPVARRLRDDPHCASSCAWASPACTTPTRPIANCTPSTR